MKFRTKLSNGWRLAKTSLTIIKKNPYLLVFPILSGITLVLTIASFFGGLTVVFPEAPSQKVVKYGILFLVYLIAFFIMVFFNTALIYCAMKIFKNEQTSAKEGLSFAYSRIGKIAQWALLSATVGVILALLRDRGIIGKQIAKFIGFAWSLATYFVVPILVCHDKSAMEAVKESGQIIKEKWGESLVGNFSFGLFYFIGFFLLPIPFILLGFLVHPLFLVCIYFLFPLTIIVLSAAKMVFSAALYNYANGLPISDFSAQTLDAVFVEK